jgi:hypothetical protein
MMLKIFKNKKAQNTAEYAILIAIVVGGVVAMQTYAQRTMQGRIRDANVLFRDSTGNIGNTLQYEPYYSNSTSQTDKSQTSEETGKMQSKDSQTIKKADAYSDRTEYASNAVVATNQEAEKDLGF